MSLRVKQNKHTAVRFDSTGKPYALDLRRHNARVKTYKQTKKAMSTPTVDFEEVL